MQTLPSSYFEAATRLRNYAKLNRLDTEFAAKGGRIVYLFDTSILEAYWRNRPKDISGAHGTERLMTDKAAALSGSLTLQYLIEGKLPGMGPQGYMSTPHWNEALARARSVAREARRHDGFNVGDPASLEHLLQLLERHRSRPLDLIAAAEAAKLGDTLAAVVGAVSYEHRLQATFRRGRSGQPGVQDVAFSEFWDAAKDAVSHADFSVWHREIIAARPATGPKSSEIASANRNDALTFAAIRAMLRENPAAGGAEPEVRFVFVTADRALHTANEAMLPQLQRDGVLSFIRHPHVYAPILNYSNMTYHQELGEGERLELRRVFEQVELTLKALLPFEIVPGRADERRSLLELRRNITRWSRISERLQLVNSAFILNDLPNKPELIDRIAKILSAPDVREAVAGMLESSIFSIREDHVQGVSGLALDRLATTAERQLGSANGRIHRAPVKLLDVDVLAEIGMASPGRSNPTTWLDQLLSRIRSGEEPNVLEDVVRTIRAAWTDPGRMAAAHLLASCIYFAVGAWDSARLCAQLCRERLTGPAWRGVWMREARYCEAVATRMRLLSATDVEAALKGLTDNLADYHSHLAQARDRVERATLMLDAAVAQSIDDVSAPSSVSLERMPELVAAELVRNYFDKAATDLRLVLETIDNFDLSSFSQPAVRIRLQAEINVVGTLIFRYLLADRLSDEKGDPHALEAALRVLEASVVEYDVPLPATGEIYLNVGRAILGDVEAGARAFAVLSAPQVGQERSRADRLERQYLANALVQLNA